MSLDLARSLREVKGIGPSRERQLVAEGVRDVGGLLYHVPSRYEDRRAVTAVAEASEEGSYTFEGRLHDVRLTLRRGRRFSLVRGSFEDDSGTLAVVWFNRPYLPKQVKSETRYLLHGKVRRRAGGLELQNPSCEPISSAVHTGRIVPVYAPLGPLGPSLVRRVLANLISDWNLSDDLSDPIPADLLEQRSLSPLGRALEALHRPGEDVAVEELNQRSSAAHRRLIYGELFEFQLRLAEARRRARRQTKSHRVEWTPEIERIVNDMLPFELTRAQRRVVGEVLSDLGSSRPMRRLVQGDVGSGKTAVAAAAFVAVVESGLQAAFMAPTELLAEQHCATLGSLLGDRYRVELLTGSTSSSPALRDGLRDGTIDLVVGTHALIQQGVEFHRLGLAVVDEQHRFGVSQRTELGDKGYRTDLLVMTATPIPRTLTLTAYGDLDLSVIDELPPGRSAVDTAVVSERERERVYDRLAAEIGGGGQAYVVFPTIRQRSGIGWISLEQGAREIRGRLPAVRIESIHGRLPVEERVRLMEEFASGEVRVLLSTTVIEVGVDVPEATVMVIEGAERFGLAQLHQLRGRVGRGKDAAFCLAVHGDLTEEARRRLEVFATTTDGFEIAEQDLLIRGPGELLGKRQAGAPRFRVADLGADTELLEAARQDARRIAKRCAPKDLGDLIGRLGGDAAHMERLARA